jgi:hypothetical protein
VTWYQAHIAAVGLLFLAIATALGGDPGAAAEPDVDDGRVGGRGGAHDTVGGRGRGPEPAGVTAVPDIDLRQIVALDGRQFVAGFLFGLACTARLTVVFAAPFFALVGSGGDWRRRAWSSGLGAALPILALVLYNVVTTGDVFHPAYDYLYALEANGYPTLGYHPQWAVEDPRYIPQNLGIALFGLPDVFPSTLPDSIAVLPTPVCIPPEVTRGLFDLGCPLAVPRDIGMSVLLTSPAYLLVIPAVRGVTRSRLVGGAVLAILTVSMVNLMHFSQGWVQFGYRFSNDVAPFAMLLVALGAERLAHRHAWGLPVAASLLVLSLAINLWGVLWSRLLGW